MRTPLPADVRRMLAAQAVRAFAYGFGAVLLGVTLHQRGYSPDLVGTVLTAVVAGTVVASGLLARCADRVGRRAAPIGIYLPVAAGGAGIPPPAPTCVLPSCPANWARVTRGV